MISLILNWLKGRGRKLHIGTEDILVIIAICFVMGLGTGLTILMNGTSDSTNQTFIYYDNSLAGVSSDPNKPMNTQNLIDLTFGEGVSNDLGARLDECGVWNRSLSASEISDLYNSGNGLAYPFTSTSDTLNMSSALPANNTQFDFSSVNFNVSVNSSFTFNCSLWLDGVSNETQSGFGAGSVGAAVGVAAAIVISDGGDSFGEKIFCYTYLKLMRENKQTEDYK